VNIELRPDKENPGQFKVQQLPISELAFASKDTLHMSSIAFVEIPEFHDSV